MWRPVTARSISRLCPGRASSPAGPASSATSNSTLPCPRMPGRSSGTGMARSPSAHAPDVVDRKRRPRPMTHTVRQLMDEEASGLVGRDEEMALLRRMLGDGGPLVVFLHGIAGIGKSAIAEAFAIDARSQGATVLQLDGRAIQPT